MREIYRYEEEYVVMQRNEFQLFAIIKTCKCVENWNGNAIKRNAKMK